MQTRPLGVSGLTVPVLGLGCNNFGYSLDQGQTDAQSRRGLIHPQHRAAQAIGEIEKGIGKIQEP